MFYNNETFELASGNDAHSVFNVQILNGVIRTCYKDAYDDFYEISFSLKDFLRVKKKVPYFSAESNRRNCFVSDDFPMSFIRYQNSNTYYHQLDFYHWKSGRQMIYESLDLHEVRLLKEIRGHIVAAGVGFNTDLLTVYIKQQVYY